MFRINKKIILISALASVILILLFSTAANAVQCEVDNIKENLRKALYLYFTTQNSTLLPVSEIKDLLIFYLSISPSEVAVDCSGLGSASNKPIFEIVNKGENISAIVPKCSDGTEYGRCSAIKPKYCYAGAMYEKCEACGCPSNSVCGKSGKCEAVSQNIACYKNIDCGTSIFVGNYYCSSNSVYKNLINYTCVNAGTSNASCIPVNGSVWIAYCNPSLNQICVSGQNTCQTKVKDNAPTAAITVNPASVAAGQAFNVTVTGTDDIGLAAIWWWAENTTDLELNKAHWYSCNSAKICTNSWLASTGALGTIKLGANSRDTSYPVAGEAHQASEGAGIAYAAVAVGAGVNTTKTTNVRCEIDYNSNVQNNVKCTVNYLGQIASCTIPAASSGYHLCDPTPLITIAQPEPNVGYSPVSGLSGTFENISCGTIGTAYNTNYYFVNCKNPSNLNQTKTNLSVTLIFPNGGEVWAPGNTYLIQWKHPLGGGFSGDENMAWGINLYRPGDGVWDHGHTVIPVNQSSYQWTIPTTLPSASDYKARVFLSKNCIYSTSPCPEPSQILPDGSSDDSDAPLTVQATNKPDLVVADMTFVPVNPKSSDLIKINITVKNIGSAAAGNSVLQVNYDPGWYTRLSIPSLASGAAYYSLLSWYLDPNSYIFTAVADKDSQVLEQDENNNVLVKSLVVTSAAANQTNTTAAQGLVGHWRFDGNGNNEVVGGPAATIVGASSFYSTGGVSGGYAYIPSSSDSVRIPYNSAFDLPNSFTIDFWFRQRSNQSFNQNLIYKGSPINNYNFYIFRYLWDQNNRGAVITGFTSSSSGYWKQTSNPNEPPHNVWHHVVYTKDTTGSAYYIDGKLIHSSSYTDSARTPASDIIIGDSAVDTDIDDLKIYNRALGAGEI